MADCTNLYTDQEIIDKIKAIDTELDEGTTRSELDTGQSKHEYTQSLRQLERQRERYLSMLQTQNPSLYRCMFGNSVIKFGRSTCQ